MSKHFGYAKLCCFLSKNKRCFPLTLVGDRLPNWLFDGLGDLAVIKVTFVWFAEYFGITDDADFDRTEFRFFVTPYMFWESPYDDEC